MLAAAYVLRLEDLAREHHAATVAAGVAAALGRPVDADSWESARARFDAALAEPPDGDQGHDDGPQGIKLRALGVRR